MKHTQKAWVIAATMGYGHERAAYALREIAQGGNVINANGYPGMPMSDKKLWKNSRTFYETVSRIKSMPVVGSYLFEAYDKLQEIRPFYPRRDMSRPTLQLTQLYRLIEQGFGRHLIDKLREKPLPIVTTFFMPAFAAEVHGYPGEIYCVATDADISRAWAPLDPKKSRIKYFAPTGRVVERLKLYGVPAKNIFFTGFPLPTELVDGANPVELKRDLSRRLNNLDPQGIFRRHYDETLHGHLGKRWHLRNKKRTLTLTFAIGGAGAQFRLAEQVLKSLSVRIERGDIILNLVPGTHADVRDSFIKKINEFNLKPYLGKNLNLIYASDWARYYRQFTGLLKNTDVLWTKPSELSFYTAAGLPIIMAPPIGSQEAFNGTWLRAVGGGIPQNDPKYTNEWLFDWVESGGLARMAWSGYIEAPTHGSYRIRSIITHEVFPLEHLPLIV